MSEAWPPKLGDLFPGQKTTDDGVMRRLREVGFDLRPATAQSPLGGGDKNDEGLKPQLFRGADMQPDPQQQPQQPQGIPGNILQQAEALRQSGATVGIPLIIQLDERTLVQLAAGKNFQQPTFGQEIARFSTKAAIAGAVGLGAALTFWAITKPAEMPM